MAIVRAPDGSLRVQASGVNLPWILGEDRAKDYGLADAGQPGLTDASRGALAFRGIPDQGRPSWMPQDAPRVTMTPSRSDAAAPIRTLTGTINPGSVSLANEDEKGRPLFQNPFAEQPKAPPAPSAEEKQAMGDAAAHGGAAEAPKKAGAKPLPGGAKATDDLPDAHAPSYADRLASAHSGARLIPGKMQLAGYSRQVGAPKEDLARMNESAAQATDAEIESTQRQAMGETIRNANQAQLLGQQIDHKQALVGQAEQKINAARAEYDQTQAEINNERGKVDSLDQDPHRYFAGNGSVAKIIGLIAAAVGGGIQSGLNGGRNQYLDNVMKLVADDNAEHRRRIDVRRGAVNLRQKQLDARMAHFDPDTAMREMEADKLSIAAAMDQKFAAQTKNPEIIAASQSRVAQLLAQRDAIRAENDTKLGDQITERHIQTPDRVVGGTPALKPEARERMVRLPDGTYGFARTSAQAKEVQDKLTPGTDIIAGLQELKQLRKEAGNVNIAPTQVSAIKQRMRAIAQGLAPRMNVRVGQGAMSKDEAAIKMQQLGDPEAIIAGEADKAIEETERMERRENDSIVRDYLTQDPEATTPVTNPGSQHRRRE